MIFSLSDVDAYMYKTTCRRICSGKFVGRLNFGRVYKDMRWDLVKVMGKRRMNGRYESENFLKLFLKNLLTKPARRDIIIERQGKAILRG